MLVWILHHSSPKLLLGGGEDENDCHGAARRGEEVWTWIWRRAKKMKEMKKKTKRNYTKSNFLYGILHIYIELYLLSRVKIDR